MKVLFFTEGGKNKGFGHLSRCLALYQGFRDEGQEAEIMVNGDESVDFLLPNVNHYRLDWLKNLKESLGRVKPRDIVIIDSYLAPLKFYKKLSKLVKVAIYLDDYQRLDYPEGTVINSAIGAEKINYPRKPKVKYLLGIEYFPLKKEFCSGGAKIIRKDIARVMITFGGEDSRNLTPLVLEILSREYPHWQKRVIIGRAFQNLSQIKRSTDRQTDLIFEAKPQEMRNQMREADLAISAAGQTLYELASLGVPTIGIKERKNQETNIRGFSKAGFLKYVLRWQDSHFSQKIREIIKNLLAASERQDLSRGGQQLVDGKGVERVVSYLLKQVKEKYVTS